ncbi:putative poly-beta-1,6-N-acetyl-D-glucosamine export protein [Gammaproteobacteria bacterium]
MPEKKSPYLQDVHGFRGVAILFIVAAHVSGTYLYHHQQVVGEYEPERLLTAINEVLWHNTTIYFSLISGLLFSVVSAARGWVAFFYSRTKNVLFPYIVMSALFTFVDYHVEVANGFFYIYRGGPVPYLKTLLKNILLGSAALPYWYIPVLFLLFLLTPIIWFLVRKTPAAVLVMALLPLLFSRTSILLSAQSVVFFLGAYTIGMYLGIDYNKSIRYLRSKIHLFAMIAVITTTILLAWYINNWPIGGLVSIEESIFYLQKLAFAALLLVFLNHYQKRLPKHLEVFANYAFTIYFIHTFFLHMLTVFALRLVPPPVSMTGLIVIIVVVLVAVVSICVGVGIGLRRIFGRHSRIIIGA